MEDYTAPWWLPSGHAQTVAPYVADRKRLAYDNSDKRERWETPDKDDFIDVDWFGPAHAPRLLVLFHGIEGGSQSHYARRICTHALASGGWRCAVPHFRGCSGEPNRTPRAYHAADSQEIDWILRRFSAKHNEVQAKRKEVHAVGVSLGANALLKWLCETGAEAASVVHRAASVSAMLDVPAFGEAMMRPLNRLYGWNFLYRTPMRRKALEKFERFRGELWRRGLWEARVRAATTLPAFDQALVAPLHGFRDEQHYWQSASSKDSLSGIRVPTLLLNAHNDPFHPGSKLPDKHTLPATVEAVFPAQGGHAGFPGRNQWLARRVLEFLSRP